MGGTDESVLNEDLRKLLRQEVRRQRVKARLRQEEEQAHHTRDHSVPDGHGVPLSEPPQEQKRKDQLVEEDSHRHEKKRAKREAAEAARKHQKKKSTKEEE